MRYNFWPRGEDSQSIATREKTTIAILYACWITLFVVSFAYGLS